eukprot:GDKJ01029372.1.p1 GENE.GDKJ01029372.1~~GDKJ01029372.1.p1  ORF type:complete len:506 (-),score=81.60 GDKJ01029372.1:89-1507(-)
MNWPATASDFQRDRTMIDVSLSSLQWIPDRIRLSSHWNLNVVKLPKCTAEVLTFRNISFKSDAKKQRWILYLHGGAFCLMSPANYRGMLSTLGKEANACVFAPDYRLSPEHIYPSQLNDCVDAYKYMLQDLKIDPAQICIAGDSAGGNLTLTTFLKAVGELNLPSPSSLVMISPWLDLTGSTPSAGFNNDHEILLDVPAIHKASWLYINGKFNYNQFAEVADNQELTSEETAELATASQQAGVLEKLKMKILEKRYKKKLSHPLISPSAPLNLYDKSKESFLNRTLEKIPPSLIHVSAHEALLSEGVALGAKANLLTGSVDVQVKQSGNSDFADSWAKRPLQPAPVWLTSRIPLSSTCEGIAGTKDGLEMATQRVIPLSVLETGHLGDEKDFLPLSENLNNNPHAAPSLARLSSEGYGRWLTMPEDRVAIHMFNGMFHVFHLLTPIEPTAKKAVEEIAVFVENHAQGDGFTF